MQNVPGPKIISPVTGPSSSTLQKIDRRDCLVTEVAVALDVTYQEALSIARKRFRSSPLSFEDVCAQLITRGRAGLLPDETTNNTDQKAECAEGFRFSLGTAADHLFICRDSRDLIGGAVLPA